MWRKSFPLALLMVLGLLVAAAPAQVRYRGIFSSLKAQQYGLNKAWQTSVQLDRSRGRVAHIALHVSSTDVYTLFQVVSEKGIEEFSERKINAFKNPIGVEEAKIQAYQRRDDLRDEEIKAEVVTRIVPESTIYAVTDRGVVHAIDAETGRTRWARVVGRVNHPTLQPSASDEYVAVVNGSILYVVQASDGKLVWQKQLVGVPGAGPTVTDEMVHVPTISGRIESFLLSDPKKPRKTYQSIGRTMIQLTTTGSFIAWPTDRGHVNVGIGDKGGSQWRLEADDAIVTPVTFSAKHGFLFAASVSGYVYCRKLASGDPGWDFPTGEIIEHSPIPIGDTVYVITKEGNMYAVELEFGLEKWITSRVRQFLGSSGKRLYCMDLNNRIAIIDAETGGRIATMNEQLADLQLTNWQTDRLYLGNKTGVIQCLREADLKRPVVHIALGGAEKEKGKSSQGSDGEDLKTEKKADPFDTGDKKKDDPFGTGDKKDDPFGGGDKKDDPFGGDDKDDPFGSGDKKDEKADKDDPFG